MRNCWCERWGRRDERRGEREREGGGEVLMEDAVCHSIDDEVGGG